MTVLGFVLVVYMLLVRVFLGHSKNRKSICKIINQAYLEVLITSRLKKKISSSTSSKSHNLHVRSSYFILNHFPVTIASLKENSLSF